MSILPPTFAANVSTPAKILTVILSDRFISSGLDSSLNFTSKLRDIDNVGARGGNPKN